MKWEPIETAPKDGTPVLLSVPGWGAGVVICEYVEGTTDADGWWDMYLGGDPYGLRLDADIAGWMPLPPPPEA